MENDIEKSITGAKCAYSSSSVIASSPFSRQMGNVYVCVCSWLYMCTHIHMHTCTHINTLIAVFILYLLIYIFIYLLLFLYVAVLIVAHRIFGL